MVELTYFDQLAIGYKGSSVVVNPDQILLYTRDTSGNFTKITFENGTAIEVLEEPDRIAQLTLLYIRLQNDFRVMKELVAEVKNVRAEISRSINYIYRYGMQEKESIEFLNEAQKKLLTKYAKESLLTRIVKRVKTWLHL